ncbi:MAG TPA: Rid family hydrolase [Candidatus Dormibacteraeota bacterium]|nr:Rid family hydrolase [Candidatus Dormibacteraeota bacterium]
MRPSCFISNHLRLRKGFEGLEQVSIRKRQRTAPVLWRFCFVVLLALPCFAAEQSQGDTVSLPLSQLSAIEPNASEGNSLAVVVDDVPLVHTSQLLPFTRDLKIVSRDPEAQARQVLKNVDAALQSKGSDLKHVVKLDVCLARADLVTLRKVLVENFPEHPPAVCIVVSALSDPEALVAMDAIAVVSRPSSTNRPSAELYPEQGVATAAILPDGPKIYLSGMADTNSLPQATVKTLEKLVAAIGHLGLKKSDIVQLKAFLQPVSEVNEVRREVVQFFAGSAPPLVFVEWSSPSPNPPIEIELIAPARGDFRKEPDSVTFLTPPDTTSTKVFSRVARVNHGKLIYTSSLYGPNQGSAETQIRGIFGTLKDITQKSGSDFEHLVKATYYVSDDLAGNKLNDLRPEFFNPQRPPAASKAKVTSVSLPGRSVMLDMIAVTK